MRGSGKKRGIAFGGGGTWFVAWTLSFLARSKHLGVDLGNADLTVGTSAGSIAGAFLTGGKLRRGAAEMKFLASHPRLLERMVDTTQGHPSQQRAADAIAEAKAVDRETIMDIGRFALAAQNPSAKAYERSIRLMLGQRTWPSPVHLVTAVDCFTGELIVIDHESDVPIARACAASSSLPGLNGPVWIGDRKCMDGGISGSSTHSDLLAGAERAVILAMLDLTPEQAEKRAGSFGYAERINPGTVRREAEALAKAGTRTLLVAANPSPGIDFMDPRELAGAIEQGSKRAETMIDQLKTVWD